MDELERKERPGREIRIEPSICTNNNITGKIGTIDDKGSPKTVYISIGFWVSSIEYSEENFVPDDKVSKQFARQLSRIYRKDLQSILSNNKYFPFYNDNIYVYDFPHNLNYNNKRSFVSIELNLHTLNCLKGTDTHPLKTKNDTRLFEELLSVYKTISNSDLLQNKTEFVIHKSKGK